MRIFECRQHQRHADTVIGTQRGLFGNQPAIAQYRPDRIAGEIVSTISVLLANHIEMRLQDHPGKPLPSRTGRFADNQVSGSVDRSTQATSLSPGFQGVTQTALIFGGTGNGTKRRKMRPDIGRLKVGKNRVFKGD